MTSSKTAWKNYEEVAIYLLNQFCSKFNLTAVEGKQKLVGWESGTKWEIDAKGIRKSDGAIIVIECRRLTTSRLTQEHLAAIAYRIQDLGAAGGITVSPFKLQKGANKVAEANDIEHVLLTQDSTKEDWLMTLNNLIILGKSDLVNVSVEEHVEITICDEDGNVVETRSF